MRRWFRRRQQLSLPRLLAAFAKAYPRAEFVEIGANDGEQHDHLRPHILAGGWSGVMVEPVPYVFERLQANYGRVPNVALENAAVSAEDGELPFFYLREARPDERASLPQWYDGIGSFSRSAVLSHAPQMPGIDERIVQRQVPTLSFETLCNRHGIAGPDLLVIDTEGHDWEILSVLDFQRRRPRLLIYEHFHLSPADRDACRAHVEAAGYQTMEEGFDTICLRPESDSLSRLFGRLRPGVPGVAKSAERPPDLPLHDERVPLPVGAEEDLRADHPRLQELRAAYGALDLPARVASRWSDERIGQFLDLRRFRGETLITWHYRQEPAITQRRYQSMHDDVLSRDALGLLGRLEEDGAFGCWTFECEGHPRVSRDLLESVNEIAFLERRLGLSRRERFSVLDVGAGYGRLAHRMAAAYPNLHDYTCVDAVPEATFLSEYYLRFRGVVPPARVVGLHEVEATLDPGSFDIAVNIHAFSECSSAAVEWWIGLLARLEIPALLIVPNDGDRLLTLEPDGTRRDFAPLLARAGYVRAALEPVYSPAVSDLLGVEDRFHLFHRRG